MSGLGAGVNTQMQDRESNMAGFKQCGKVIMLWSSLVRVNMGRSVGSDAFVSFLKMAIVEGNKKGIGLRQIACTC